MDRDDAARTMDLAIGRLLRLMSRPEQPGDVETYYACRRAIYDAAEAMGREIRPVSLGTHRPGWNFGNRVVD